MTRSQRGEKEVKRVLLILHSSRICFLNRRGIPTNLTCESSTAILISPHCFQVESLTS